MASTKSVVPATQAALLVLHSMFWLTCTVLVATLRAFSMYPNPEDRLKLTALPHFFSFPLSAAMAAIATWSSQISPSSQRLQQTVANCSSWRGSFSVDFAPVRVLNNSLESAPNGEGRGDDEPNRSEERIIGSMLQHRNKGGPLLGPDDGLGSGVVSHALPADLDIHFTIGEIT